MIRNPIYLKDDKVFIDCDDISALDLINQVYDMLEHLGLDDYQIVRESTSADLHLMTRSHFIEICFGCDEDAMAFKLVWE